MDWTQTFTIVGVNIALIGALATLIIWVLNKLENDIKDLGNRLDRTAQRLDGHAQRIDQLYHMFIDLLKERR